jgi:hypothetical protein
VDEEEQAETVCKTKGVEFEKITSLDIVNYLRSTANVDKEKIDNILSRLLQNSRQLNRLICFSFSISCL